TTSERTLLARSRLRADARTLRGRAGARTDFGRPLSRHDANLGAERIRNSRDKRQLWAGVARREQPADARSVAIDSPGELSLRDPEIDPQRVELADHLIGLLDLTSGALVRFPVLRVSHPLRPAALVEARIKAAVGRHRVLRIGSVA